MNKSIESNGRIDIINKTQSPDMKNLFSMYDKIPANQCINIRDTKISQWDETELSRAYFSKENLQIIQNGIRNGVYYKSNKQYVVGEQDRDVLSVIMRSVFLQHASNQTNNIVSQIEQLNMIVLEYCIFHVYSEAQSYMKYLRDISTLAVPLSAPIDTSEKHKKAHPMPKWF